MKSGPLYDRPVYHIEMQSVKKMFSGPFGGKVPHKVRAGSIAFFHPIHKKYLLGA